MAGVELLPCLTACRSLIRAGTGDTAAGRLERVAAEHCAHNVGTDRGPTQPQDLALLTASCVQPSSVVVLTAAH